MLDACAHTIPTEQLIEKWCFKLALRLATLPREHPLFKPIRVSACRKVKKHKALLHNLFQIFKLDPNSISKVATAVRNPMDASKIPLRISIANNKEESKIEAHNAPEAIKVYSDGSEINGKVGVAVTLLKAGQPSCTLHFHLGSGTEHTV
jgi:hypothetical protein